MISKENKVYIVGVGPGNPDLLTLKAHKIITKVADVFVYDRLIPKEILNLLPKKAIKVFAGKEKNNHTLTQDEINAQLLFWNKQGKTVARLKGGDAFVFSRGGEEIEFLHKNDISFEIIPGITSASSASCEMLVPLTDRRLSSKVIFITGHKAKDKPFSINWKLLAEDDITIVIYMGLSTIGEISQKLIENGKNPKTSAMAVYWTSTKEKRSLFSTLKNLSKDLAENNFSSPTTIIIGNVVNIGKSFVKL